MTPAVLATATGAAWSRVSDLPGLAAAWVHDLDPVAVRLPSGGPVDGLRWYGLAYLAGFLVGGLLIRRVLRHGRSPLPAHATLDLMTWLAAGVIVGGRLGYCVFYSPELWVTFDRGFPFWGVLQIQNGGMASHGGMLGVAAALWLFSRRHRVPFLHLLDLTAFAAPVGLFCGRVANFINGELWGRAAPEGFPLAVRFPQELGGVVAEQVRAGVPSAIQLTEELATPRHPSPLYAAVLEGLIVFAVVAWVYRDPRRPGIAAGAFGVVYAAARFLGEFFREPDEQIGLTLGLSRGQWLSLAMAVVSVGLLVYATRRKDVEALGGWLRGSRV